MKLTMRFSTALGLFAIGGLLACGQTARNSDQAIPLIVIDNTPFTDAVWNLARQTAQNCILDPRVKGKTVTARFENMSGGRALEQILREQGYELIKNPATGVNRIAATNLNVKPVSPGQIQGDTNTIPLIIMDDTPLGIAIQQLAARTGLQWEVDPQLSESSRNAAGKFVLPIMVSFRWENISAAQAVAALVDNYDLTATKDPATGKYRIARKESSPAKPSIPASAETPKPVK